VKNKNFFSYFVRRLPDETLNDSTEKSANFGHIQGRFKENWEIVSFYFILNRSK
jgi:hypothetical protein